jgi:recombinational DNA repair protein RecR
MEEKKEKEEKAKKAEKEKKHTCSICARPSETVICHACEDRIRGEALEHKHEVDKAGRTDSGRR